MKEHFVDHKFSLDALELIATITVILDEYEADGYDLSLRQLYYQLVSKALIENTEQSYKRIGGIVSDARLAGLIDWDIIKDRGREAVSNRHWANPAEILEEDSRVFRIDLWADQPAYVEVMVEKQALEGVLEPVCRALDVTFTANKGYSSSSAMYEAGKRLDGAAAIDAEVDDGNMDEKQLVVFYLGDHDPSGIDMTRDVEERLSLFADRPVDVRRIALNMDQIKALKPPPNPAKMTDSRATEYVKKFGSSSWELDAIEPRRLADLVTKAVESVRDEKLWRQALARQNKMRETLYDYAEAYRKKTKKKP